MSQHYFTFGQSHAHSVNGKTFDKDCVAVIHSHSVEHARECMFAWFGDKFHQQYSEDTFSDEILKYYPRGLIVVNPPIKICL